MVWLDKLFSSSLGKKLVMALTGFFLVTFLIVHLAGNLQLLKNDGGRAFNVYADFMVKNPLIQIISKINLIIIFVHIFWAITLTKKNKHARGSISYKVIDKKYSSWTSRNMFFLGIIIFTFLIIHLRHFWAEMHYGNISTISYTGNEVVNLYAVAVHWFSKKWYVSLYVLSMFFVAFHLWHGFTSAFQTLGASHIKYNQGIVFIGKTIAIILPVLFAYIPIIIYLRML